MFANIFLEFEATVMKEIHTKFAEIGLEEGYFSLHEIKLDLLNADVEVEGFDKLKGREFILDYNYQSKEGRLQYFDGKIIDFNLEQES